MPPRSLISLTKLPHIDLILLHAPGEPMQRAETWRALEEAVASGLVRNIGVSNFGQAHLEKLAKTATITPAVNQIEVHPFLQRRELCAFCEAQGIVVEAYSPLTKARALDNAALVARRAARRRRPCCGGACRRASSRCPRASRPSARRRTWAP